MDKQKFVWLALRNTARNGTVLQHKAVYDVAEFGEAIVAEWVIAGAAAYVADDPALKKNIKKPAKGEE
jgi:hypothetical protein